MQYAARKAKIISSVLLPYRGSTSIALSTAYTTKGDCASTTITFLTTLIVSYIINNNKSVFLI